MKKILFYVLAIILATVTSSSTVKRDSTSSENVKLQMKNLKKIAPYGSSSTTIYNSSSNSVTRVEVQDISGTRNFYNPSFPLSFPANGNVTVVIYFVHTGADGSIQTYKQVSGGSWSLIDCETYNTNYLSPISYTPLASEPYEIIISDSGC